MRQNGWLNTIVQNSREITRKLSNRQVILQTMLNSKTFRHFFFWGAWVCAVERPGGESSYTHNWPFDEYAGNTPTPSVILWSVIGMLFLIFGLGAVLCTYSYYSKDSQLQVREDPVDNKSVDSISSHSQSTCNIQVFCGCDCTVFHTDSGRCLDDS